MGRSHQDSMAACLSGFGPAAQVAVLVLLAVVANGSEVTHLGADDTFGNMQIAMPKAAELDVNSASTKDVEKLMGSEVDAHQRLRDSFDVSLKLGETVTGKKKPCPASSKKSVNAVKKKEAKKQDKISKKEKKVELKAHRKAAKKQVKIKRKLRAKLHKLDCGKLKGALRKACEKKEDKLKAKSNKKVRKAKKAARKSVKTAKK